MSIKKITNKRLSRNLKAKNAPLRVLPLATFHLGHRVKVNMKKHNVQEISSKPHSQSTVRCTVEKVSNITEKYVKKSCRKGPMTIKPFLRFHFAMNTFRWILLLIVIYFAAGTIAVTIQDGTESIKNIVIYSIMGFFTFFMGYLGWFLARDVLQMVTGKKSSQNELEIDT